MDRERELAYIRRVLDGDPEPFAELVRSYQNLVASVAYRMGVPRHTIEDVTSEVFMKAYTHLGSYDPQWAFSTWLYRIATNHVLDEIKRKKKEGTVAISQVSEPADPRPSAQGEAEVTERDRLVRGCLSELPEEYQRVLVLKHFEDLPVSEIARALAIPEGTVKIRLMRGRIRLRKILEARHPEHFPALPSAGEDA